MSSPNPTSICHAASLMLGAQTINDLYTDPTDRARLFAGLYPFARDMLLRSHNWKCATKRVQLAPDVTTPAFDYSFQYLKPGDWIRTLSVGERGFETDQFESEGLYILCNDNPLNLRYIFKNDNESTWDSMLVAGMTLAMKAAAAYPLTLSQAVADSAQNQVAQFLKQARAIDGQENTPETLGDFRLLNARLVSSSWAR